MAQDIVASVVGLKNSIDNLSARIRATGERGMSRLRESREMARMDSLIKTSSEIDAAYSKVRKTKDLLRAARAMRHNPDKWSSPGEYLRWEEATRGRNKKEFLREQKVSDTVRSILYPETQHKYNLEREYGKSGAERILAAEDYDREEKGRKAYEWDILPDGEKKLRTLTEKYGGGERGAQMAQDVIQRTQRENLARLDMSDYEAFIHDHSADYGGRAGADAAYRKMLIKQLPPFFKDSKLSTKSLIAMQQVLKSTSGIPLVGPTLHRMIANPVAGIAGLGYAALLGGLQASDKANEKAVGWQNAVNLYGAPSRKFTEAAMLAGLKDPGQISKLYGQMTSRFGDAEAFMSAIGSTMGAMDPLGRMRVAKELGLDESAVALIDIFTKNKHLSVDDARKTNMYKNVAENVKTLGFASGSGAGKTIESLWLSIPGMTSGAARDMRGLDHVKNAYMTDFFDEMDNTVNKTRDAAESLKNTEAAQGTTANYNSSSNHAVYINELNVASNNPDDFVNGMEKMSDGSPNSNRAVLASLGTGMLA